MSHISKYEQGNISQFGGVPFRTIPNELDGRIDIKNIQSQGHGSTHQNQFAPTRTDRCAHQAVRGSLVKDTFQATIFIQVKQKVFINFRARFLGFPARGPRVQTNRPGHELQVGCPRQRFLAINSGNARERVWFFAGLLSCLFHTTYQKFRVHWASFGHQNFTW